MLNIETVFTRSILLSSLLPHLFLHCGFSLSGFSVKLLPLIYIIIVSLLQKLYYVE